MVLFPVYPWLHVQVKLPRLLVHVALESQVVALAHSSISDYHIVSIEIIDVLSFNSHNLKKKLLKLYVLLTVHNYHSIIPSQVVPFPVYPWLHVQVKLPGVLVHVALESQLLVVASAHSSISVKITLIMLLASNNYSYLCSAENYATYSTAVLQTSEICS